MLSHTHLYNGGFNILYPLYKWKILFKKKGIHFNYCNDFCSPLIQRGRIVFIISRYFNNLLLHKKIKDRNVIKDFLCDLKNRGKYVVYFDSSDSTGSRDFDLIPIVDVFLKKQLLKDKSKYLINNGDKSVRCWINVYDEAMKASYQPCTSDNLHKIGLGWNIGLVDYRNFGKLIKYIGCFTNNIHYAPFLVSPKNMRNIDTSFRGATNKDTVYSWQRNTIISKLNDFKKSNSKLNIVLGGKISRAKYLRELGNSKITLSPFGWGEICYRDFESFLSGSILMKPSVEHIETYPSYFINNKTYLAIDWSLEKLEDQLLFVLDNYSKYIDIANEGQEHFIKLSNDGDGFVNHFLTSIRLSIK